MDLNWNVNSITWNATSLDSGAAEIYSSSTTLTLQAGLNNNSGGQINVYPNIVLPAFQAWNDTTTQTSATGGPGTVIYGAISGPGGIEKTGTGTLLLNSTANSFSGGLTITAGVVQGADGGALGTSTGSVQLNGGILRFVPSSSTVTVNQNIVLNSGASSIQSRFGNVTFNGSISGSAALQLVPDSSIGSFRQSDYTWSGTNTYSGGTVLGAVSVSITGTSQSLGTGGVTVQDGGVLSLSAETNLAPGQKVALQTGGVVVLNNAAINPAHVIDSNPANTTGGTLSLGVNYASPLDMSTIGNGQLFLGSTGNVNYTAATLGAAADGVYRVGGGSGPLNSTAPSLTFSGTNNLFTGTNSVLVGSSHLSLQREAMSSSTIVFSNANNYSGGTTLYAGTLAVGNDNALGSGLLTFAGGALKSSSDARTIPNSVLFTSLAHLGGTATLTFTGPVDLGGNSPQLFGSTTGTIFANTISDGGLVLLGGSWTLAAANTFSGGVTVGNNATLSFSSDGNFGAAGTPIAFLQGVLKPTASVTTNRPLTIGSSNGNTVNTNGQILTFCGSVAANGDFTKTGAGTLIFSGGVTSVANANGLSTATIQQGTLQLQNSNSGSTLAYTVQNGATLSGTGFAGWTDIAPGGHLSPGVNGSGNLSFTSVLDLAGGAYVDFNLGSASSDEILLAGGGLGQGSGQPAGKVLVNLFDDGGLTPGQTYTLFDWSNGGTSTLPATDFQVASGPVGGTFAVVGDTLQLTTTSIPEPATASMLLGGLALLGSRRRR
ncbi:MAG: autotransporter-associated beta strand repeat-containing protein [Chthoniobacter sp.]|nr:autotransporter-associated beta strand repeat-containing protein [Chthoniobacter sp.]